MKKEKKMIFLLIVLIGLVILIDGAIVFVNKKEEIPTPEPPKNEEDNRTKIAYREYLCKTNPESRNKNNFSYDYNREYTFQILNDEIIYGLYKDRMKFKSQQELEQYLNDPNFSSGNFKLNVDSNHLEVTFEKTMLLEKSQYDDMTYTESYLESIKNNGFICQISDE